MKVVVVYLDLDGYEAFREEYVWPEIPDEYRPIIDEMMNAKVRVRQVGDKIIEVV